MDTSEKRFERDIESFLISEKGGYQQFVGQDADGNWIIILILQWSGLIRTAT